MYPYILQGNSLTIVIGTKQHTINRETHPNFNKVLDAMREGNWDDVESLIDMTHAIRDYVSANGDIEVRGGDVYFDGRPFHNAIADRLLSMLDEDFPVDPLCEFLTNLKTNPSKRAVDELYGFLESNNLPITPDGHFLAYKKVRDDYTDIHSGKFDNSVGQVVSMLRNEVNENKDQTCSAGLHFCSLEYLPNFGDANARVVILKINPRDVVSIPSDYNNAKGRCCRYEVVDDHEGENRDRTEAFDSSVVDYGTRPREVVHADNGKYRYANNGYYASRQAFDDWQNYRDERGI